MTSSTFSFKAASHFGHARLTNYLYALSLVLATLPDADSARLPMTDRVDHRFTNSASAQSSAELYLDAYSLKPALNGLPANTDSGSSKILLAQSGTESTAKDSKGVTNSDRKETLDLYDMTMGRSQKASDGQRPPAINRPADAQRPADAHRPADARRPAEIKSPADVAKPTDVKKDVRPEVRLRPGEKIQDAINRAPEGSTVLVPPGVYNEKLNITRDNFTLKADGKAVLDLAGRSVNGAAINISDRKNVTIDGFEIRNVRGGETPTAIRVNGSSDNIKIINNDIHHVESSSNAHAIGVFGTKATPLKNITIANNKVHDLKLGQSEAVVLNGNVDGFKITGNNIYNTDNIAIDIIGGEGVGKAGIDRARNGLISRNTIRNVDSLFNPTYGERSAAAIYVDGGKNVVIEDNNIQKSNYGIELASERRDWNTEGITVRRNTISGTELAGISLGGGSPRNGGVIDSIVENNDLRGNHNPIWQQHNVRNVIIRNNRTR